MTKEVNLDKVEKQAKIKLKSKFMLKIILNL